MKRLWTRKEKRRTMNWKGSGHESLWNRLTAIRRPSPSLPLYTVFGTHSLCSDTMFPGENPSVAILSCSKLNSLNISGYCPPSSPSSSSWLSTTVDVIDGGGFSRKDLKQMHPIAAGQNLVERHFPPPKKYYTFSFLCSKQIQTINIYFYKGKKNTFKF